VVCDAESRDERYETLEEGLKSELHGSPLKLVVEARGVGKIAHITAISENAAEHKGQVMVGKVAEAQKEDRFCRGVIEFWSEGKLPRSEIGQQEYLRKIEGFRASNGMVFRIPDKGERYPPRPYVPNKKLREEILDTYHKDPQFAHPGVARMKARVAYDFWWPDLGLDVEKYVSACQGCGVNKPHQTVRTPLQPIERMGAWKFVSIDHVGPFKKTARGYTHGMVIMDRHTRWVEIAAVKGAKKEGGMTAEEVLRKYKKRVENRHGQPEVILTDNSTSFQGEFAAYLKEHGVEHRAGTAYHHNTNGMAERMIRSVEEALRHYVNSGQNDWDLILGEIQCALNTHKSAGPRSSAFFLNHGREHVARETKKYVRFDLGERDEEAEQEREEEGARVEVEVGKANERAEEANRQAQESMKRAYDRRNKVDEGKLVKVGDWVMVKLVEERQEGKLGPRNEGPYKVVGIDERRNCTVEGIGKGMRKVYAMDILSLFRGGEPGVREYMRSQEIDLSALVKGAKGTAKRKVTRAVKSVREVTGCGETINPADLMGRRVRVTWSSKFAKGDYDGTLVDYDPHSKLIYIKYDEPDKNGVEIFEDSLFSLRMPPWIMLPDKEKR
jgi:hypothetical protein